MVVGFLLIGVVSGLVAAGISLLLGASAGWAFVVYMVAGNGAMLLIAAAVTFRNPSSDVSPDIADCQHLGNRNLHPVEYRHPLVQASQHGKLHPEYRRKIYGNKRENREDIF